MAAPTLVTASTGSTDATGAWTHTAAAPGAVGRILLVQLVQDGTLASPTITSVTNAEDLAGTDNTLTFIGEFDIGSAVSASQHLWIGRSTSTSAMVITGANSGGDDVYVRVYEFDNVNTGTAITNVIENGSAGATANGAGTGTTISDTGVTTLGPDRLALQLVGANDDIAIDAFAGETGGDWIEAVAEYAEASGTDAALQLQIAYPATDSGMATSGVGNVFGATGLEEMRAQSFTPGASFTVAGVVLRIGKTGSPADDLVVELQTDSAGVPSGSALDSASLAGSAISTTATWLSFDLSTSVTSGTKYWIVLSRSGSRDTSNGYFINYSFGLYAGGSGFTRNSGTWSDFGSDYGFAVFPSTGGTINGGSDTVVSAGWGVVGFALIGTTSVSAPGPSSFGRQRRAHRFLTTR